jgi:hypothetical protein
MCLLFIDTVVTLLPFSVPSSCSALFYNTLHKYRLPPALTGLPIKNISLAFERTSVSEKAYVFLIILEHIDLCTYVGE